MHNIIHLNNLAVSLNNLVAAFPAELNEALSIVREEFPIAFFETVYSTFLAVFFSYLIGLPLGVLLVTGAKNGIKPLPKAVLSVLEFIINVLRSVPFLILVVAVFPLTRLIAGTIVGTPASIVPLVVAGFPFVARLTENSLKRINQNTVKAVKSMGATYFQIVFYVMLPESLPSIISDVTTATATMLGYTAMSGMLGGGGLGKIAINYGYYRYKYLVMILAVILLVLLVQVIQFAGKKISEKADKRKA